MAINSVSYGPTFLNQSMLNLNNQLTILQSQLTTGKKSTSYAGMGVNEGFAIAARSQLANISAFTDTMGNINTSINIANTALQGMVDIGTTVENSANSSSQNLNSAGQTIAQQPRRLSWLRCWEFSICRRATAICFRAAPSIRRRSPRWMLFSTAPPPRPD